jgi:D-alanine-D-alanine ligase
MAMAERLRVGVIFGGRSGEHEVSLMSARSVLRALDPQRYEVTEIGITLGGEWLAARLGSEVDVLQAFQDGKLEQLVPATILPDPSRPGLYALNDAGTRWEFLTGLDAVFPVLHGTFGEDGTLQGLLELVDVAYVGAGVLGSSLGMDKGVFHAVMRAHSIPVVETQVFLRRELQADPQGVLAQAEQVAPYPLFIKPANLGSSVGVSKVQSHSDLYEGLLEAARFDRRILVQRGVNAREIEVAVLGNDDPQASVPGEILPSREFYSYEAKYVDNASGLLIPAPIPAETAALARSLAVQAYQAIDCAGMARVDFLLDKDSGALYLNEVNTIPGFTQISMYAKLWEATGMSYPELVDRLIALAMERKAERDQIERRYER